MLHLAYWGVGVEDTDAGCGGVDADDDDADDGDADDDDADDDDADDGDADDDDADDNWWCKKAIVRGLGWAH